MPQIETESEKNSRKLSFLPFLYNFSINFERLGGLEYSKR